MTMNNGNKSAGGSLGSLIVGAALGAAAVTMLHEPTRKNLKNKIRKAMDESDKKLDEMKGKAMEVKKDLTNKAVKELNKTTRKLAGTTQTTGR